MGADALGLAAAIRNGQTTATDQMEAALAAASIWADRALGAICYLDAARGRAAAAAFDALPAHAPERAAPFAGLPSLVKDLGAPFPGFPISAGSALFPRIGAGEGSDLATRFAAAGLIPFGMTTSPEFGLSLASEPAIGPLARNPLNLSLSPGGSSGGAAASVAAGIVPLAHATDAGGSIRVPAAACGLVGLKPGRGSVPGGPGFGNHLGGIASELAVCRSVRDARGMFQAIAGGNTRGPYAPVAFASANIGALRIGVLTDTGQDWPTQPERQAAVAEAGATLAAAGHQIKPLNWAMLETLCRESAAAFTDIVAINLAEWAEAASLDLARVEPITAATIALGQSLSATAIWARLNAMLGVSRDLSRLFDDCDAILTPMLSSAPLPLGSFPSDHQDTALHFHRMSTLAPLAALANISGFPAITLPFGADAAGLPLPVQVLAPLGGEPVLLSLAAQLEAAGRWQHPHALAGLA